MLNNYIEKDNNQQNSWIKPVKDTESGLLVFSTYCTDRISVSGDALLGQRERWQILLMIPQKGATVSVEEQSGRRSYLGPCQDLRAKGVTGESSDCPVCSPN